MGLGRVTMGSITGTKRLLQAIFIFRKSSSLKLSRGGFLKVQVKTEKLRKNLQLSRAMVITAEVDV